MKLNKTYIGRWLSLIRIQSTPVTVITLCLGYITVSQRLNLYEMVPLVVVGCLGHWGFYAQNDVIDYQYDLEHKSIDKPLISNVISKFEAQVVSAILITLSVILAILIFNTVTALWFILSATFGLTYNYTSKTSAYSGFYLSYWGATVVMTGASQAGQPTSVSYALAIGIAVHMLMMTIIGDIKDIDADEPSIPNLLGVNIGIECRLIVPESMHKLQITLETIEDGLICAIAFIGVARPGGNVIILLITIAGLVVRGKTLRSIFNQNIFDASKLKKQIALHEAVSVTVYIIALSSFISLQSVLVLIIGSVVWGLLWQKVMYGEMLYFP